MAIVYDVPAEELIEAVAKDLKEKQKLACPDWAKFVKTGSNAERCPENPDWWWVRAASVLRKVYVDGPIGVSRLRTVYGGRKNKGVKPERFRRAGGKILRTILQELDELSFTKKTDKSQNPPLKGRIITKEGQSYLDKVATDILMTKKNK
jgi:small subunit ribosomal protein S19e